MNLDYLACVSQRGAPALEPRLADALQARGCRRVFSSGRVVLFAAEDVPVRTVAGGRGCIIGHLFDGCGRAAPADRDLDPALLDPEALASRFWGSYVLLAGHGPTFAAYRDPSGGLACYHASTGAAHLFTSSPHLLVDCGLLAAELDPDAVGLLLAQHSLRVARTALRGIDELLPGSALSLDGGRPQERRLWDPWAAARCAAPADPAGRLRDTLCSTLKAWGRSFRRPLIEISGGLDSAIVAAGLSAGAPGTALVTFAAAPGDSDETPYAQAIADHLGLPLAIVRPRVEDADLRRSLSADLPRPNARAFTQAADALSLGHGRAIGADVFVSGGGGDDVFGYLRTVLPAVDRFRVEGLGGMIASALDIAAMNHATFWEALFRIGRRLVRRGSAAPRYDTRFLTADVRPAIAAELEQDRAADRLPGKAAHVRSVTTIHNYLEGHARAAFAPILSPLLSQPIVECCLSIPSWMWCAGGRNRAVARRAFEGRLPRLVLERRSKGRFDGFCAALLERNRNLVREMLLEGWLAGQGILDGHAVGAALDSPFPAADVVSRLLMLVDAESWTAAWLRRSVQRS